MPPLTTTTQIQTEQFLMFLAYEDKLTKLYQRIKTSQVQKTQLTDKLSLMYEKIKLLEKSLLNDHQPKTPPTEATKSNQHLLKQVITLQQQLLKHSNPNPKPKKDNKIKNKKNKNDDKCKTQQIKPPPGLHYLCIIKQQAELSCQSYTTDKQNKILRDQQTINTITYPNNNNNKNIKMKKNDEVSLLTEKINHLYQQLEKQEKSKKIVDIENKRLRKLNAEYSNKCKKLQKLLQAKSELCNTLHHTFSNSGQPMPMTSTYLLNEVEPPKLFQ